MKVRRLARMLGLLVAGCAAPAQTTAPSSATAAGPRFAAGGPDAEDYGASKGYPIGDRRTFYDIPVLVGSHSHMDEIFEGRPIRKAATPSPLKRASAEPEIRWQFQGLELNLDDYLARKPATGLLTARG